MTDPAPHPLAPPPLAAVLFDPQQPVDQAILTALAGYRRSGHPARIIGYLQEYSSRTDCDCDDIVLTPLHGRDRRVITQQLGSGARGCRLDSGALAEVAGWLAADLAQASVPPDLLILNRFGKSEAEGGGLRAVLEQALAAGIAVLVPVNRKQLAFWHAYTGGLAQDLPCEAGAIRDWVHPLMGADQSPRVVNGAAPPASH